jgi:hypothetical protein
VTGTLANSFGANTNVITLGDSTGTSSATLRGAGAVTFANPITVASGNTGIATDHRHGQQHLQRRGHAEQPRSHADRRGQQPYAERQHDGLPGTVTLNASGAGVITKSGTANHTGTITNSGVGAATSVISAAIGANVTGVTQNSATSALTLSGANTYGGDTTISAGNTQRQWRQCNTQWFAGDARRRGRRGTQPGCGRDDRQSVRRWGERRQRHARGEHAYGE